MSDECFVREWCKKSNECMAEGSCFCQKLFKLEALYRDSLLSQKQCKKINLKYDADGTDRDKFVFLSEIQKNIEEFVSSGQNLYIHSKICGNGKTAWAVRLMQSYFNAIWHKCSFDCHGLYINVPKFVLELKNSITKPSEYIDKIKENVYNADIVIWDEVGAKNATQFEFDNLFSMINGRIDCGKSNIYTSNLSAEELSNVIGDRLYSRIVNLSTEIEFFGRDKRGL